MVKKKLLSVVLVASTVCSMLLTGCGNDAGNTESGSTDTNTSTVAQTEEVVADDVEKPEKITIMVSGRFPGYPGERSGRMDRQMGRTDRN